MNYKALFFALFSITLFYPLSSAQTCKTYNFANSNRYRSCIDLPVLNSFIHWNYDNTTGIVNIAFRNSGTASSSWIAWGLNPTRPAMEGTQAIVAFHNSTGQFQAYTTQLSSTPTLMQTDLSFSVSDISATYVDNTEGIIFASLVVPRDWNSINQVWQVGSAVRGSPGAHPKIGDNMRSVSSINFRSGETTSVASDVDSRLRRRNIHGVLNAVSWGVMMPVGAMMARYVRVFADPTWFYLHVGIQASAYVIGVAGWATGLKLGSESTSIQYNRHRYLGITLFVLATLQVFAVLLRPKPDHKYRIYWNFYHHSVGYATLIISIRNIVEGLNILEPGAHWKWTYLGIIIGLGCIAAILEVVTWAVVLRRKKAIAAKYPGTTNVANGV